jgi:hypothetical protein
MSAIATAILISFGTKALSRFGGQKLADKMADLVNLQREELKLLHQLQSDMDQLIAEPFRTACRLVDDASRSWRSESESLRLLDEARSSLTRALAQDTDALRLSVAALLLASIWEIQGAHDDAMLCLVEAWTSAVEASKTIADKDPPPGGRVSRILFPMKNRRPRSVRIHTVGRVSIVNLNLVQLKAFKASSKAKKQEQELLALHEYVQWLRETLISLGRSSEDFPTYCPTIVRSYNGGIQLLSTLAIAYISYALEYAEVSKLDETKVMLSDTMAPVGFKLGIARGAEFDDITFHRRSPLNRIYSRGDANPPDLVV